MQCQLLLWGRRSGASWGDVVAALGCWSWHGPGMVAGMTSRSVPYGAILALDRDAPEAGLWLRSEAVRMIRCALVDYGGGGASAQHLGMASESLARLLRAYPELVPREWQPSEHVRRARQLRPAPVPAPCKPCGQPDSAVRRKARKNRGRANTRAAASGSGKPAGTGSDPNTRG